MFKKKKATIYITWSKSQWYIQSHILRYDCAIICTKSQLIFLLQTCKVHSEFFPHTPICLHIQWLFLQPLHVWFWRCGKRSNHSEHQSLTAVPAIQWASPPWACPQSIYKGRGGIFRAAEGATILNTDTPSNVGTQPPPRQMATGHQNAC